MTRTLGHVVLALALACGLGLLAAAPAAAELVCVQETTETNQQGQVVVVCEKWVEQGTPSDPGTPGDPGTSEPWDGSGVEMRRIPHCMQNGSPDDPSSDMMCLGATLGCDEGETRYRVYTRPTMWGEPTGDWEVQGVECYGPGDNPEEPEPPTITADMVMGQAFKAAPEPTGSIEPGTWSMVNIPNNYFTDAAETDVTLQVLGVPIPVTFIPVSHTWSFGDGGSATGDGVEGASVGASGAVEHAYSRQGSYDVTVTRAYTVRVALPQGTVTVPGAFEVTGPVGTLPVREMQTRVQSIG